jgi:nucleotide-binding universal stress UspA family protein
VISTIAVATDGSATAGKAVETAVDLARGMGANLVLLSAYTDSGHRTEGGAAEVQWATSNSARAREILNRLEADLTGQGIECTSQVAEGSPADVLVQLASESGADLLVIGNKGMERRVLGSVPNTVTHTAPCSVLVVKTT